MTAKKAKLEVLDEHDHVVSEEIVDDFLPLDPKASAHIPKGVKKFRLTLLNEDGTEAQGSEIFVVGTRSEIIQILTNRGRDTQLGIFLGKHGKASETDEFVAIDQGDVLTHITRLPHAS